MERRDITRLLQDWRGGDAGALDELTPMVYEQLKALAERVFRQESPGHTLQPTALVHEAFESLIGADVEWHDRNHFYALSARLMRRLLVNHANGRKAQKRGGDVLHVTFHDDLNGNADETADDILLLDTALAELNAFDERKSSILELHYFAGLTYVELADVMGVSESTIHTSLRTAKAWLHNRVSEVD